MPEKRPELPEPLISLAMQAMGADDLRQLMGGVPRRTFSRWAAIIRAHGTEALPRSAKTAIRQAETALKERLVIS